MTKEYKYISFQSTPEQEKYLRTLAFVCDTDKSNLIKLAIKELEKAIPEKVNRAKELLAA